MVAKKQKSAIAYALLALFLGVLGVHKFYAGKAGQGWLMLLLFIGGITLSVVDLMAVGSGVLATLGGLMVWGVSIWAFVDMIIGFCHAGNPQKLFKK